jgi:hypothetical protein
VEAFDVGTGQWLSLPHMPTERHGLGVVAVGTVVYTIAGGTVPGLSVSDAVEAIAGLAAVGGMSPSGCDPPLR